MSDDIPDKAAGEEIRRVSILLAYDENYKELSDFEMIPVGNKDYMNTRHGIMYKPKITTA